MIVHGGGGGLHCGGGGRAHLGDDGVHQGGGGGAHVRSDGGDAQRDFQRFLSSLSFSKLYP